MEELDRFEVDGVLHCRLHGTPLVFDPDWALSLFGEYLGMMGSMSEQFPNAKWGHPATPEIAGHELVGLWHCPQCEADRQRWIAALEDDRLR